LAETEFTGERVVPGQVSDDLWAEHFARYAFARRFASGKRVLDAGSGTGYGAAELAIEAASVTGIDVAEEAIDQARAAYPLPNLRFVCAPCGQIPFDDGSFDLITAFEVIEHLKDPASLIAEASRLLAPGGMFLVSTPNRLYYEKTREEAGPNLFHEREFEAREFLDALHVEFPLVELMLQNRVDAFAFHAASLPWPADVRIDSSGGDERHAHFFLAVCAKDAALPHQAFVYVPKAANMLRERELYVEALQRQLILARSERDRLITHATEQKLELEEHNRWAHSLNDRLEEARINTERLESENLSKIAWARSIETDLAEARAALDDRQKTIEERTAWARSESELRSRLEGQLGLVRASRWVRLGRKLNIGPDLEHS
jgi:SAM-dependent methyltransferase